MIASGLDKVATHSIRCGRNTEAYYGATRHGGIVRGIAVGVVFLPWKMDENGSFSMENDGFTTSMGKYEVMNLDGSCPNGKSTMTIHDWGIYSEYVLPSKAHDLEKCWRRFEINGILWVLMGLASENGWWINLDWFKVIGLPKEKLP